MYGIDQYHRDSVNLVPLRNRIRLRKKIPCLYPLDDALFQRFRLFESVAISHGPDILRHPDQGKAVRINTGIPSPGAGILFLFAVPCQHIAADRIAVNGILIQEIPGSLHPIF